MSNLNIFSKIYISLILIFSISLFQHKTSSAECIWINKSGSLSAYELTSIAADKENPKIIYVGSKGFLFKTSDGGESWKEIFKVPGANKAVNLISLHPSDSKIVYIATESGIFKSADGGVNWQASSAGIEEDDVLTLLIDSKNSDTLFAATKKDMFVTKNAGENWTLSSQGLSAINIQSIAQNYADGETLFVSAENGLFKSIDGAKTWTKVFSADSVIEGEYFEDEYIKDEELSISPTWVLVDSFNPGVIYLSAKRVVFKSKDNGDSWQRLSKIGLPRGDIRNLVSPSYKEGFIFAAAENGIFRFSEQENMWRNLYAGLTSKEAVFAELNASEDALWLVIKNGVFKSEGNIYEIKEVSLDERAKTIFQNFSHEPSYHEIQKAAVEYAEVHPEKIAKWRRAAKTKALLPRLTFGIERDSSKSLHWDSGANPDTWVIGPEEEDTGWDISCSWDLGDLIWNESQTSIDVRSRLMVQLRDDILDEVTHLYFARRKLQIELMQDPPKDVNELIEKELRLQELTADIDAMTGGYLSQEIERRKQECAIN